MLAILALTLGVIYTIYVWVNAKPKNYPPGPPCLPFIGSVLSMPKQNIHLSMMKWRHTYGSLTGFIMAGQPLVAVCGPKEVQEVLRREEFQGRPNMFIFIERSFNKKLGVFFSDGHYWVEQRRFTLRHLREFGFGKKSMESVMHQEVDELLAHLKSSEITEVSGLFNIPVLNVLWCVMAGKRFSHDDKEFKDILERLFKAFRSGNPSGGIVNIYPALRHIMPKSSGYSIVKETNNASQQLLRKIVEEHEKTLDANNPRDFIDVYILEQRLQKNVEDSTFSTEGLIVTCMDLFGAGAESVSNTMGFCLLYLVLHPQVQEKVQEELDRVVGRSRKVALEDRSSLPFTEAVLSEVSRINTIAPLCPPHRATKDTYFDGQFIPKDTFLIISLWSILHDKEHWGDPEVFRPERFIDSDGKFVKDEWLTPFGIGKRFCMGEPLARNSLFIFFSCILQEFSFSLPEGDPSPSTQALPGFTTAPQPFRVKITHRL